MTVTTSNTVETERLGETIGARLKGGETIELISDLGGGKTQFVRGLARGMGSGDAVQSPSFTISRIYNSKSLELYHYDFHRLSDPGLMQHELAEAIGREGTVVAIEWADTVRDVLPPDRLRVTIRATGETNREVVIEATGPLHRHLLESSI